MLKSFSRFLSDSGFLLLPVMLFVLLTAFFGLFYLLFGDAFFNTLFGPVGVIVLIAVTLIFHYAASALMNIADDDSTAPARGAARPAAKARHKPRARHKPAASATAAVRHQPAISSPQNPASPAIAENTPRWKTVFKGIAIIGLMLTPFLGMSGIIVFIGIVIITFMLPTAQSRFMRYQQLLPTSKIRSMATGIVELEGNLLAQQQIEAPLSGQRCIGYYHTIEREERGRDGNTRYRLIHEEKRCQPFRLQDGTGKVQVEADTLDFHLLSANKTVRRGREIEREYLLEQGPNYLLIGQAVRRGGEQVIVRDKLRRVFGIAPAGNLLRRSKLDALFSRARYFIAATALAVALLLVAPIEVQRHQVIIHFAQWLSFTHSAPLLSGIVQ